MLLCIFAMQPQQERHGWSHNVSFAGSATALPFFIDEDATEHSNIEVHSAKMISEQLRIVAYRSFRTHKLQSLGSKCLCMLVGSHNRTFRSGDRHFEHFLHSLLWSRDGSHGLRMSSSTWDNDCIGLLVGVHPNDTHLLSSIDNIVRTCWASLSLVTRSQVIRRLCVPAVPTRRWWWLVRHICTIDEIFREKLVRECKFGVKLF